MLAVAFFEDDSTRCANLAHSEGDITKQLLHS